MPLANAAGVSAVAVSEWCLAAALSLSRKLAEADAAVRAGHWPQQGLQPRELHGRQVGVVGYGPIGAACARLFRAFGCQVSYWTRTPRAEPGYQELAPLLSTSDVVVVVIALSDETRGLIDPRRLKQGALLVNAARGGVVDQAALADALTGGHLGGRARRVRDRAPARRRRAARDRRRAAVAARRGDAGVHRTTATATMATSPPRWTATRWPT